jgi:hypothetical protein
MLILFTWKKQEQCCCANHDEFIFLKGRQVPSSHLENAWLLILIGFCDKGVQSLSSAECLITIM